MRNKLVLNQPHILIFEHSLAHIVLKLEISHGSFYYNQVKIPMHYPVMLTNVIKAISSLNIHRKFAVADCNFGLGGHSNGILKAFPNSLITAYDLDQAIIDKYKQTPQLQTGDQNRLKIVNSNFIDVLKLDQKIDVLLADLGFNSVQLEEQNGFSWNKNTPLDMIYSKGAQPCSTLINSLSFVDLMDILIKYGDLNSTQAKLAAKKIEECRPINTTFQLRDCIVGCFQTNKTKKIAQVFQAMRIATNHQIQSLRTLCASMDKTLNKNALILFITFHSLERDIIYKQIKLKQKHYSKIKVQHPSDVQIQENSRSRSAQMLIFKKID